MQNFEERNIKKIGFCALKSGSSGNSYLIRTAEASILLDAGMSNKAIKEAIERFGMLPEDIDAIFITHEHSDHIKGLRVLMKNTRCNVYMSHGTLNEMERRGEALQYDRIEEVEDGQVVNIGDIRVECFRLSHDAREPIGYTFTVRDDSGLKSVKKKVSVVTDTGYVSDTIFENIKDSDILAIEANHERNILLAGAYPYPLKVRILSEVGHLSNDSCADCLVNFMKYRAERAEKENAEDADGKAANETSEPSVPTIFLAHLSRENNTPDQAEITIRYTLEEAGFVKDRDYILHVIAHGEMSDTVEI